MKKGEIVVGIQKRGVQVNTYLNRLALQTFGIEAHHQIMHTAPFDYQDTTQANIHTGFQLGLPAWGRLQVERYIQPTRERPHVLLAKNYLTLIADVATLSGATIVGLHEGNIQSGILAKFALSAMEHVVYDSVSAVKERRAIRSSYTPKLRK